MEIKKINMSIFLRCIECREVSDTFVSFGRFYPCVLWSKSPLEDKRTAKSSDKHESLIRVQLFLHTELTAISCL